jgi:hypothetical protein
MSNILVGIWKQAARDLPNQPAETCFTDKG